MPGQPPSGMVPLEYDSRWAIGWVDWYKSEGERGTEPPESIRARYDLYEKAQVALTLEERRDDIHQIADIAADEFEIFAIASAATNYGVVKEGLLNVRPSQPRDHAVPAVADAALDLVLGRLIPPETSRVRRLYGAPSTTDGAQKHVHRPLHPAPPALVDPAALRRVGDRLPDHPGAAGRLPDLAGGEAGRERTGPRPEDARRDARALWPRSSRSSSSTGNGSAASSSATSACPSNGAGR